MMMTVVMWWFLAQAYGNHVLGVAQAFGPYPSAEFCRKAAKDAMPTDKQFWTAQERALQDRKDRAYAEKIALQRTALKNKAAATKSTVSGEVGIWTETFNAKGETVSVESGSFMGTMIDGTSHVNYSTVIGCSPIETPDPKDAK